MCSLDVLATRWASLLKALIYRDQVAILNPGIHLRFVCISQRPIVGGGYFNHRTVEEDRNMRLGDGVWNRVMNRVGLEPLSP